MLPLKSVDCRTTSKLSVPDTIRFLTYLVLGEPRLDVLDHFQTLVNQHGVLTCTIATVETTYWLAQARHSSRSLGTAHTGLSISLPRVCIMWAHGSTTPEPHGGCKETQ